MNSAKSSGGTLDMAGLISTRALLCLDASTGARICCKYYGLGAGNLTPQLELERSIFAKCGVSSGGSAASNLPTFQECMLVSDPTVAGGLHPVASNPLTPGAAACLVVGKQALDTLFFVVGPPNENEVLLHSILGAWFSAVESLCGVHGVEKRVLFENMDVMLLIMDECIDEGILLESDGKMIASRVSRAGEGDDMAAAFMNTDQTLSSALRIAQEQLARSLLK